MNITSIGNRCTGCGCCAALCPAACIDMRPDREGFLAPHVDAAKCTDCGLCLKRCPVSQAKASAANPAPETYAAHSRDDESLRKSSSGALFSEMARDAFSRGGRVYGAVLRRDRADIVGADDEAGASAMRGSKYVQSTISKDTYAEIKKTLEAGREVLFTGCPCHVAAVRAYLGKPYDAFTAVDIVCHGVPSPLLFQKYTSYLAARAGGTLDAFHFRDKQKGWGMYFSYSVNGKARLRRCAFDPYLHNFLEGRTYRESCYQCPFAQSVRTGDATIGDYWGILQEHPDFYDERGVSLLIASTEKGKELFERVKPRVAWKKSTFAQAAAHNRNLVRPTERPGARDSMYEGLASMPMNEYVRVKLKISHSPKELVKVLIPVNLKKAYQALMGRKHK